MPPKSQKMIRLPAEVWAWLEAEAERQHRSQANMLEVLLRERMDDHDR